MLTFEEQFELVEFIQARLAQEIRTEFEQKNNLLYRKIFG